MFDRLKCRFYRLCGLSVFILLAGCFETLEKEKRRVMVGRHSRARLLRIG